MTGGSFNQWGGTMAMVCCFACRSYPRIFISASFVPSLFGWNRKVYSGRREADLVMSSAINLSLFRRPVMGEVVDGDAASGRDLGFVAKLDERGRRTHGFAQE